MNHAMPARNRTLAAVEVQSQAEDVVGRMDAQQLLADALAAQPRFVSRREPVMDSEPHGPQLVRGEGD